MGKFTLNIDVESMYGIDNKDGLVIDREGKVFQETEAIYSVGKCVYEHICDLQKEEADQCYGINEFIEEKGSFIAEVYKRLILQLSDHGNFILSFPDGREIGGSDLREHVCTSSLDDIIHMGLCLEDALANEMEIRVIPWHKSGVHAVMFFWEVNRSFDEYFQYHESPTMMEILNDCWLHREKMSNIIFADAVRKENARKAARSRHAETDSMKDEVLKIYDENKAEYKSVADAARKLSRVVPVTDRTIDKWIRQNTRS